jgi:hypothetical protein
VTSNTRRRVALGLLYLTAIPAGLASAWWSLHRAEAFGSAAGPWRVSLLAGSTEADAHTRARVALGGLLALNRGETMYYVARTDSKGEPLRSRCTYRIDGTPPAARWWSITAYAEDLFLFPNEARRYGINGASVVLDAERRFAFVSGPAAPAGTSGAGATAASAASPPSAAPLPWVPTPGDRGLSFTLRLYQPAAALQAAPQSLDPPRIEPLGDCR